MAFNFNTDLPAFAVAGAVRRIVTKHITAIDVVQDSIVNLISLARLLQKLRERPGELRHVHQRRLPADPLIAVINKKLWPRIDTGDDTAFRVGKGSGLHYF